MIVFTDPRVWLSSNTLNIPQCGQFTSSLKELTTVKAQDSHCRVVSRETQPQLFSAVVGKNTSINSHWPCRRSGSTKFDNILESISKSGTDQGLWIDHEAFRAAELCLYQEHYCCWFKKIGCQSIVCEVLHLLCLRSDFCVLQYHPLKCICCCWHLGK